MSVEYCEYCHKYIDTDYNSEHFDSENYRCVEEEDDNQQNI